MNLEVLLKQVGLSLVGSEHLSVTGLAYDSRLVKKGDLFFAIPGTKSDGHNYVEDVQKKGAVMCVVEKDVATSANTLRVPSVLTTMSKMAKVYYGHPSSKFPVIGVTGTNGKTTTTYLIENALAALGKTCGVMGTVNYRIGANEWPAPNTTPMSLDVQEFLHNALQSNAFAVAMEVSSHALELKRVEDVQYAVRVFTNLTQDHLDFHKTMEAYYAAKAKLFHRPESGHAVINIDDSYGQRLLKEVPGAMSYGFSESAQLRAVNPICNLSGLQFELKFSSGAKRLITTNLLGRHNIYNLLSAAGALLALGLSEQDVVSGLSRPHKIPGRLDRVEMGQKFVVAVDYAHTDDALAQVLKTLRETHPKRLLCVFGAGGDRDKTKRPKMGAVAVSMSDFVYVTSDNPRTESPGAILDDIEAGIKKSGQTNYTRIEDRAAAIRQAIQDCKEGDILLIAGKGHEDYQIIGTTKHHFSDFEVAREAISKCN